MISSLLYMVIFMNFLFYLFFYNRFYYNNQVSIILQYEFQTHDLNINIHIHATLTHHIRFLYIIAYNIYFLERYEFAFFKFILTKHAPIYAGIYLY